MLLISKPIAVQNLSMENDSEKLMQVRLKSCPEFYKIEFNQMALYILGLCNGDNTIEYILNHLCAKYPSTSAEIIYKDLTNTLKFMEKIRLIKYNNDNEGFIDESSFKIGNYTLILLNEKLIKKQFPNLQKSYKDPLLNQEIYYSKHNAITLNFYNLEKTFMLFDNSQKTIGIVSVCPSQNKSSAFLISRFYFEENVEKYIRKNVFLKIYSILSDLFSSVLIHNKFRIHTTNVDCEIEKQLLNFGFMKVGTLEDEVNEKENVDIFDLKIDSIQ